MKMFTYASGFKKRERERMKIYKRLRKGVRKMKRQRKYTFGL